MKLILETEQNAYYYCHFKGGNLIIVQRYDGVEHVYTYAEAIRLGIVQYDAEGNRIIVGHNHTMNPFHFTKVINRF